MTDPKVKISINYNRCDPKKCDKGVCAARQVCPTNLIKQIEPRDYPFPVAGFCQECGKCSDACLLKAISML